LIAPKKPEGYQLGLNGQLHVSAVSKSLQTLTTRHEQLMAGYSTVMYGNKQGGMLAMPSEQENNQYVFKPLPSPKSTDLPWCQV